MSFPSCTIRDVAETLVTSNFSSFIPQEFDILNCVPAETSNVFEITIKYNITWQPEYADLASTEAMELETRLVQQILTYTGNDSVYVESLKVIELREGSVIAVFQLKYYNLQLRTSDVKSGTVQMILQVRGDPKTEFDLIKVADPDSVIVVSKKGKLNILLVRGDPRSQLDLMKVADPESVIVVSKQIRRGVLYSLFCFIRLEGEYYIPCLKNRTDKYEMNCTKGEISNSLQKERQFIKEMTKGVLDFTATCGGDVCLSYTNYMYVEEEEDCTIAIGNEEQQDPLGLFCKKYNVYLSCVTTNIKEKHQCDKFSLHSWLPGYIDKRYNISGADRCNGKFYY
ncbi:unnamed protein product [Mytilus coruscus]|uniref:Uncharacterized protein n=1 Tax=Mytilus coruscus TaxID=42192 RepID=A0A6J8EZM2_MYTCO|nr:unnamed protein product [Mytilus coruscus]